MNESLEAVKGRSSSGAPFAALGQRMADCATTPCGKIAGTQMTAHARARSLDSPRAHYQRNYCGAFVLDPDGYNIEAVCHTP